MDQSAKGKKATKKDLFMAACRAWGKAEGQGSVISAENEASKMRQVDRILLAMQEFAMELPKLISPKDRLSAGFKAAKKACLAETKARIKALKKAGKKLPRSEALMRKHSTRGIKARKNQYQDVLWYADNEKGRGVEAFRDLVAKPGKGEKPLQWTKIARRCAVPRVEAAKAMRAALNVGFAADGSIFYLGKDVEATHKVKTRSVKDSDGKEVTERYCQTARNDEEDVEVVLHQIPGGLQYKACLKLLADAEPAANSWAKFVKDVDEIQRLTHEEFQLDTEADEA